MSSPKNAMTTQKPRSARINDTTISSVRPTSSEIKAFNLKMAKKRQLQDTSKALEPCWQIELVSATSEKLYYRGVTLKGQVPTTKNRDLAPSWGSQQAAQLVATEISGHIDATEWVAVPY